MGATSNENRTEVVSLTIDVASVAANTTAEQTFTLPGLLTTDKVLSVSKPSLSAGLGICGWRVSAANTIAISFNNNTGAPIDPASESYTIVVMRPERVQTGAFNP